MEMMIRFLYLGLVFFLIVWAIQAEEITTGNLLPNGTNAPSNYQSVDSSIPNITTNGFTVEGNIRGWGQELETTGTGSINYTGTLIDIVTNNDTTNQQKLDNGITLNSSTVVQNCEWVGSNWQCGQAKQGQDTFTTTVKILDEDGNTLAIVNQTRNNDAGYGANAFKYEDTVTYSGAGSNQFYWEWEGVDVGYDTYGTNLGGPNLLGAKLTMTYDNTVIPEETIEEIIEVIEEFELWEQTFEEVEFIEEVIPLPLVLEELLPILLEEEEYFEQIQTNQELEKEFEEVEILQVFEEPTNEPQEEEVNTEPSMATNEKELMEEQSEQSQTATMETNEQKLESEQPQTKSLGLKVADIQKEISKTIKAVDKQLAVTNIIVADVMEKKQVSLQSYYKQMVDDRVIYNNQQYVDKLDLSIYHKQIYAENKMINVAMNDPLYKYQEDVRQATLKRVILEKELKQLRGY